MVAVGACSALTARLQAMRSASLLAWYGVAGNDCKGVGVHHDMLGVIAAETQLSALLDKSPRAIWDISIGYGYRDLFPS